MNYVQVGDKELPFRYSFKVIKKYCNKFKIGGFGEFMRHVDDLPIANLPALLFYGFEAGARAEGEEVEFKMADVEDWIDEDFALIERCMTALGNDLTGGKQEGEKN
jgi:hypothetical protein